jgi:hypothetical protein
MRFWMLLICLAMPLAGCENLAPATTEPRDTTIDQISIPTTRPTTQRSQHLIRNLVGGELGAAGGHLIGAKPEFLNNGPDRAKHREAAVKASKLAEQSPAKPESVEKARTADLNDDGCVTLDEVVAMRRANLGDGEMLDRLRAAHQVYDLSEYQEDYLRTRGVSDAVIHAMKQQP